MELSHVCLIFNVFFVCHIMKNYIILYMNREKNECGVEACYFNMIRPLSEWLIYINQCYEEGKIFDCLSMNETRAIARNTGASFIQSEAFGELYLENDC